MATASKIIGIIALLFGVYAFGRVGLVYIIDPVPNASLWGFDAVAPAAITNLRAGIGGFHLAFALILLVALLSGRHLEGLMVFLILTATVIGSRLIGVAVDGADPLTFRIMIGEAVGFGVAAAALLMVSLYPPRPSPQ